MHTYSRTVRSLVHGYIIIEFSDEDERVLTGQCRIFMINLLRQRYNTPELRLTE